VALAALALAPIVARAEDGLRLFAAGSLTAAMTAMLVESGLPQDRIAPPVFGPSGVLRERIEGGAPADLLASADMTQPRRLPVIMFTRNSLCALGRAGLGLTTADVLDRMLDPPVKLATSTPGFHPVGLAD
jgi:ABC-type molybdate transport system substrate-binding protein